MMIHELNSEKKLLAFNRRRQLIRGIWNSGAYVGASLFLVCVFMPTHAALARPENPITVTRNDMGPTSFPMPLTVSDLQEYDEELHLATAQWLGILRFHASYRSRYYQDINPRLRDYDRLTARSMPADGDMTMKETLPLITSMVSKRHDLFNSIAALDGQFFDSMRDILSDQQQDRLDMLAMRRERQRHRGEAMLQGDGIAVVDLSDLARRLLRGDLAEESSPNVDLAINGYERRLTGLERRLHASTEQLYVEMTRRFIRAGHIATNVPDDVEAAAEIRMEALEAWLDVIRPAHKIRSQIESANRRLLSDIEAAGASRLARRLRHAYICSKYANQSLDTLVALNEGWEEALTALKRREKGQVDAVDALVQQWRRRGDRAARHLIDELPEIYNEDNFQIGQQIAYDEVGLELAAAREEYEVLQRRLGEILGEERVVALERTRQAGAARSRSRRTSSRALGRRSGGEVVGEFHMTKDHRRPIDRERVKQIAARGGVDFDADETSFNRLYDDYALSFTKEYARLREQIQTTKMSPPSGGDYEASMTDARRHVIPALEAIDENLWNSLRESFEGMNPSSLKAARQVRHRALLRSVLGDSESYWQWVSSESSIDLVNIAGSLDLPTAARLALDAVLTRYNREASEIAQLQYEAMLSLHFAKSVERRRRRSGRNSLDRTQTWLKIEQAQNHLAAENQAAIELNRNTLMSLRKVLADDVFAKVRDRYQREAYASLVADPGSLKRMIDAAIRLPDLQESARQTISNDGVEYVREYDALADGIIALVAQLPAGPLSKKNDRFGNVFQGELRRYILYRNDINATMSVLLQFLLSEGQLNAIGFVRPVSH
ncbi:MAG: hypothetical protein IID30_07130 [Planctomycetes bacterium]|nr:hypothetical protein [Planctomycetota bacterium]